MTKRRSFSREFKRETSGIMRDRGFSDCETCRQLDLGEMDLCGWAEQVKFARDSGVPKADAGSLRDINVKTPMKNWMNIGTEARFNKLNQSRVKNKLTSVYQRRTSSNNEIVVHS